MKQKISILALLVLLLLIAGGKAYSQCSYVSTNEQGVATKFDIPCDFPVLISTGNPVQDTLTYKSAAIEWNNSHATLTFLSVLPGPVATQNLIEIPASIFISFSPDRQASIKRTPYYYKVKL